MEWAPQRHAVARSAAAWIGAVLAFGLVLVGLTNAGSTVTSAADSGLLGRLGTAPVAYTDGHATFPWSAWGAFALLSLLVVACGWAGRRWLGFGVALTSLLISGSGAAVPHVLAAGLWGSLDPPTLGAATPGWPVRVAVVVQTALALAPLLAVPQATPRVPATLTAVRLLAPAALATTVAVLLVPEVDVATVGYLLVAVPSGVAVVGLTVSGAGPGWFRLLVVPLLTTAVWSPWLGAQGFGWAEGPTLTLSVLAVALATVGWLFALRQLRELPEAVAEPAR